MEGAGEFGGSLRLVGEYTCKEYLLSKVGFRGIYLELRIKCDEVTNRMSRSTPKRPFLKSNVISLSCRPWGSENRDQCAFSRGLPTGPLGETTMQSSPFPAPSPNLLRGLTKDVDLKKKKVMHMSLLARLFHTEQSPVQDESRTNLNYNLPRTRNPQIQATRWDVCEQSQQQPMVKLIFVPQRTSQPPPQNLMFILSPSQRDMKNPAGGSIPLPAFNPPKTAFPPSYYIISICICPLVHPGKSCGQGRRIVVFATLGHLGSCFPGGGGGFHIPKKKNQPRE